MCTILSGGNSDKASCGSENPSGAREILKLKLVSVGSIGFLDQCIDLHESKNAVGPIKILVLKQIKTVSGSTNNKYMCDFTFMIGIS